MKLDLFRRTFMSRKPDRIALIEADAARRELLRAIVTDSASAAKIQVFSSEAEARSQLDDCRSAIFFAALPPADRPAKSERRRQPPSGPAAKSLAEDDGSESPLADFAHAVRGSLGVIQNSVFVLKRKGSDEHILNEFLELIEQQVKTLGPALADYVETVRDRSADA